MSVGGAMTAISRSRGAGAGDACASGEIFGPLTSWDRDPRLPSPPAPTTATTNAATTAIGTSAAAVPARRSWRSHAPTRSMEPMIGRRARGQGRS
jgi:hypothetical protein